MDWSPVYIHDGDCVTPLGCGLSANWQELIRGKSGLAKVNVGVFQDIYAGQVPNDVLRNIMTKEEDSPLERMLLAAAASVVQKHVPTKRTAFVLSTTKGNISFLRKGKQREAALPALAKKIANRLGFVTEPIVVSHACVSGLLAVIMAKRLLQAGLYDDAVVLAGDELSEFVLSGFNAFQVMSPVPCKPFDKDRQGVSLGEATACVYLSRQESAFRILGESSINDANHISGPSRTGEGLYRSVQGAVKEAGIALSAIDYISAHGTATLYNDEMEAIAFNRLGLSDVPLNSLKGYYGHTLGASGLLELLLALKSAEEGMLLPTFGFEELGVSQPVHIITEKLPQQVKRILKTTSGFGGSNAAMIVEKV